MEKLTNNVQGLTDSTAALENRAISRGAASGASVPSLLTAPTPSLNLGLKYRFWTGEVIGFVFVLLLTFYIIMVPASLSKPALVGAMLNRVIKRALDIVGASIGLVLTAPLWLLIGLFIKIDSAGPVFYTQTRIAANRRKYDRRCFQCATVSDGRREERRRTDYLGAPFTVIKFRTMGNDAEQQSGPVWAVSGDSRVTRVGSILRKTHLDELPQFLNVLKGDMALVGPRPERPEFVAELSGKVDNYTRRLQVKPGITGLAQIENGYDDSIASVVRKVQYDLRYIDEQTMWSDVKILARTVVVVLTGRDGRKGASNSNIDGLCGK